MVEAAHRAAMAIEVNRPYLTARFHSQQSLGSLIYVLISAA